MDWLGIGVLIIGIAFLILVIVLIKPLGKLTTVLEDVQKTTDRLPNTLTDVTGQATTVLQTGNKTIENVNDKVNQMSPLFQIVGDVGQASREFTSAAVDKTIEFKQHTSEAHALSQRNKYEGFYGLLSLVYYLVQRKSELKKAIPGSDFKKS